MLSRSVSSTLATVTAVDSSRTFTPLACYFSPSCRTGLSSTAVVLGFIAAVLAEAVYKLAGGHGALLLRGIGKHSKTSI